jgi:L-seryl-tRNA(Ser) seleniumtransferase
MAEPPQHPVAENRRVRTMPHTERRAGRAEGNGLGRRELLKMAGLSGAAPLLAWPERLHASLPSCSPAIDPGASTASQGGHAPVGIYERMLGVRPLINAAGAVTAFGGTLLSREVTDAMAAASRSFVDLNELYTAAGARLAEVTGAEAAMVTSGAFAAMTLAAAACLARDDEQKIAALPQPAWPRREVLLQRAHSTPYDRAYRNGGATLVYVDTEEEMVAAIGDRTAMIAGLMNTVKMAQSGIISLERLVAVGRHAGVPVYLDASFSVTHLSDPPSLSRYNRMGFDLVGISGGKGLHGPQSTGILAGRADLIAAARKQASPTPSALGRGMKVDKEEVVGLLVAVEQFLRRDSRALYRRDRARVDAMRNRLRDIPGLRIGYEEAFFGPGLVLMWDETEIPLAYPAFVERMREGERPIAIHIASGPSAYFVADVNGPALFAGYLDDGEEIIVAERAREILVAARQRLAVSPAPSARWIGWDASRAFAAAGREGA